MDSKGISPIVASILIVLVVVGLAGTYTVWSSRIFGEVAEEGEETVTHTTRALFSNFDIQGASGQQVYIKNTGSGQLSASALQIFYDDEPIKFSADFDVLEKDGLGTLTLRELWKFGTGDHNLRITAGGFSDSGKLTTNPARGTRVDWRFEESSGSTVEDYSENNNDGTITAASRSNGIFGKALEVSGSSQYTQKDWTDFALSSFTVEFWMKADNVTSAWRDIVGLRGHADEIRFHLHSTDSSIIWYNMCSSVGHVDSDVVPKVGQWYHVVGMYDGSAAHVYVDGEKKNSKTCALSFTTSTNFVVGSDGEIFDGQIDETRFYDRALTPDELYTISLRS